MSNEQAALEPGRIAPRAAWTVTSPLLFAGATPVPEKEKKFSFPPVTPSRHIGIQQIGVFAHDQRVGACNLSHGPHGRTASGIHQDQPWRLAGSRTCAGVQACRNAAGLAGMMNVIPA